ncbi:MULTISPECIES: hypothetical protein [Okeania]|uniref:Uncharacterized protein n=1 Tax=Okeania hirsuta TaxID=1458930 RepID=A0A3N6NG38_9CYAN|nr:MULTISPECIES: hypothetical protein [Okeania]NET12122.1 hypothetical protein [Okeania sp. SIO1H6]NES75018.1 hypothetical protein [Okeania sp. SIO1H4]NES91239.1 hypothetical protein [Okeania sp. SIO2B9]NET20140.1 hypothetical protein [Okeania sp. SIO1H5]NET76794.1 hypothetical protein [Okeania sp. SIO1F9]
MLVSTFELLLKKITPTPGNIPNSDRQVLQGYFLTIANPNNTDLRLRLQFTATTPNLNVADTITIRDVAGANVFGNLIPTPDPRKFTLDVGIAAHDTGLVILQPDITTLDPQVDEVEIRGFVEIFLRAPAGNFNLLLTPEHRGTFVNNNRPRRADFDQLVYALPTPNGGSLFQLATQEAFISSQERPVVGETAVNNG